MKLDRKLIDQEMARHQLSVKDLAKSYGVSPTRMYTILNSRSVTTKCAGRVAAALDVDITDIQQK